MKKHGPKILHKKDASKVTKTGWSLSGLNPKLLKNTSREGVDERS